MFDENNPTLADQFWGMARQVGDGDVADPVTVVRQFLSVLATLSEGGQGSELSKDTLSLLNLLRRQEVAGDLTYASPEQARGEPVDERALVFSVGVLLFEKLTDRHPFGAEANSTRLARIQKAEMASGVNYFPKIPAELRAVVVKAIAAFPEERWHNLRDLRRQLESFLAYSGKSKRERTLPALPRPTAERTEPQIPQMLPKDMTGVHDRFEIVDPTTGEKTRSSAIEEYLGKRSKRRLTPMLWMGAGAIVACVIMFVVLRGVGGSEGVATTAGSDDVAPAATATEEEAPSPAPTVATLDPAKHAPGPEAGTAKAPVAEPSRPDTLDPDTAAPDTPDPATPASPAAAPTGGTFDIQVGGQLAANTAATCFAPSRLQKTPHYFGASLIYSKQTGASTKVFLGGSSSLLPGEKRCIKTKLKGLTAGGTPAQNTVVVYTLAVSSEKSSFTAKLQ